MDHAERSRPVARTCLAQPRALPSTAALQARKERIVDTAGFGEMALPREAKQDSESNAYGIVWARNASLFFKAFRSGRPNWGGRAKVEADFPVTVE